MQTLLAGSAGPADAVFIGQQSPVAGVGSQSSVLSTLGAAVGDMAIVASNGGVPTSAGGGSWITISNTAGSLKNLYWKILNSADVAGVVTPGTNNVQWQIFIMRNCITLTSVASGSGSSPTNNLAGVTKNANHAGFVALITTSNSGAWSLGLNFVKITGTMGPLTSGPNTFEGSLYYRSAPPAPTYVNNTAFPYTTNAGTAYLVVAELRR